MLITALGLLLLLLFSSISVGSGLASLAFILTYLFSDRPLHRALGEVTWGGCTNLLLVAIPLFILLGQILLVSGLADRVYGALAHWLSWLPGGLMHTNIGTCMAFAATSGSSVATAATIGTVAIPVIDKYEYNERLFLGSVAAGGTLGILIPPSIDMIIYGWITQTSVPDLYMAGFIPGIMLGLLFMLTIGIACSVRPEWGGRKVESSWKQRIASLPDLLPPVLLFILIIGSIYAGWATPTESAALGVVGALTIAFANGKLSVNVLVQAFEGTARTFGMFLFILAPAWFLNFVITVTGLANSLSDILTKQGMSPFATLMWVTLIYTILGCLMDPLPLIVVCLPIIAPVLFAAGYNPVWFGIYFVVLNETALLSPPIGLNLFVVQGVRGRGKLTDVIVGTGPFYGGLILMLILLILFPQIALWLPSMMK